MRKLKQIVEALKRGEEVEVTVELEFDERHFLLVIGIISFVVFRLLF
ncbi:hypothetical protein [Solitalea koreensis]|uniref:Uncharacterized protein n=1 Tax=Solitalea koreensis TaxID=543615 RepID=A0A521DAS0_9SPHI|nr:hypothetical protein [Solitalea koreensis]SMO67980.1 hypothetical protein SAMN06265350_10668 [Solitalea koreensis]